MTFNIYKSIITNQHKNYKISKKGGGDMEKPEFIEKNEVGIGEIEYCGKRFPYSILRKEVEPKLSGFLGFFGGKFLFISEEVPEQFRAPQLIHEIIEFTEFQGKRGRCLEALMREFNFVPPEDFKEYIKYRLKFFKSLVDFYENSDDEEFKKEIQASYEYISVL